MSLQHSNFTEIYCEPLSVLSVSVEQSDFFEAHASVNVAMVSSITILDSNEYQDLHSRANTQVC